MRHVISVALMFAASACAQSDLKITAQQLSSQDLKALFGPLSKQYGAVQVDVCSTVNKAVSVPLGTIRQQFKTAGVTVISSAVAVSVIASAQGSTKTAKALRVGVAVVELGAIASGWSGLSASLKAVLNASAIAGAQSLNVIAGAIPTNALVSYAALALSDPVQLQPMGCAAPAVQLIESIPKSQVVEFGLSLPAAPVSLTVPVTVNPITITPSQAGVTK